MKDSKGSTPFDIAKRSEQMVIVYNTALLGAVAKSDIGKAKQLLSAGVDVNVVDDPLTANRPLHWAARSTFCILK